MSNWLGFSLTPHLRIDQGLDRDEHGGFTHHHPHLSVMPLRSDGSLCVVDPFRRSSLSAAPQGTLFYLSFHSWYMQHACACVCIYIHICIYIV